MFQTWRLSSAWKGLVATAVVLDLVVLPSLFLWILSLPQQLARHTSQILPPWAAWGQILTHRAWRSDFLLMAAALIAGAVYLAWKDRPTAGSTGNDIAYGSARWRFSRELAASLTRWTANQPSPQAGLVAGIARRQRPITQAWIVSQDGHNLVAGAPGAGKSTQVLMPTLGVIASSGESAVITDPKGEMFTTTAGLFAAQGYQVVRFDLRDPAQSVRWNPLAALARQWASGDQAAATRGARELAQILTADTLPAGGDGAFWQQSGLALMTALILAVLDQAPSDQQHLASVYQTLIHTPDLDAFFAQFPPTHLASQAYGVVRLSSEDTRHSQLTITAAALNLFADPQVAWLTSAAEFDPHTMGTGRVAVYVIVPDDASAYYSLAALFITQILQALSADSAHAPGGRLSVPVHLILDEFGNLPKIPDFDKALAVARGRGIRITLALQAFSQLDARYGHDAAQTMRNACNTWLYLSSNDTDTARLISDKTGQGTIQTLSTGQNWQGTQGSRNETQAWTGRALLTPDEVLRWPKGESLLLQSGQLPARLPLARLEAWAFPQSPAPAASLRRVVQPPLWTAPLPDAAPAPNEPSEPRTLADPFVI